MDGETTGQNASDEPEEESPIAGMPYELFKSGEWATFNDEEMEAIEEMLAETAPKSTGYFTPEQVMEALDPMNQFVEDAKRFEFHCALCNRTLDEDKVFGMVLVWPVNAEGENDEQTWWVHRGCFVQMLHPHYRHMRDEETPDE